MKASERKIKREMPFEEVPAYLRRLADALEKKTDNLPTELSGLPDPIARLEVKAKARDGVWKLKIKITTEEPSPSPKPQETDDPGATQTAPPSAAQPQIDYHQVKKRMKASFRDIGEALAARNLPAAEVLNAFLADSDRMMAFTDARYGEAHYPVFREACRRLAEAYESRNRDAFSAGYTVLVQLRRDCHKACK